MPKIEYGNLFWGFFFAAIGIFGTWTMYEQFAQLEAGQLQTMRVWAPLAWIYNIGGIGSSIAKWASMLLVGAVGVAGLFMVVMTFVPEPAPQAPEDEKAAQ